MLTLLTHFIKYFIFLNWLPLFSMGVPPFNLFYLSILIITLAIMLKLYHLILLVTEGKIIVWINHLKQRRNRIMEAEHAKLPLWQHKTVDEKIIEVFHCFFTFWYHHRLGTGVSLFFASPIWFIFPLSYTPFVYMVFACVNRSFFTTLHCQVYLDFPTHSSRWIHHYAIAALQRWTSNRYGCEGHQVYAV